MRAILCSLLSVAVLSGCSCGSDATVIASDLNNPTALIVVGNSLFWLESITTGNGINPANGAIRTMPTSGGKPTTVLTQAGLDGNLTSDGSSLYFSYTPANSKTGTIASCGLDGSNVKTLNSGSFVTQYNQGPIGVTYMFAVGGTLYFPARVDPNVNPLSLDNIYSMPVTGGTPGPAAQLPSSPPPNIIDSLAEAINYADSTGVYFPYQETPVAPSGTTWHFVSMALGGGTPTDLLVQDFTQSEGTVDELPGADAVAVVNSTPYFISGNNPSSNSISLMSGAGKVLATFTDQSCDSLVGDTNGLYMNQTVASSEGIYSVSLTGSQKAFYNDNKLAFSTSVGNERHLALDSKNVYWVGGGFNSGQAVIHSKAR